MKKFNLSLIPAALLKSVKEDCNWDVEGGTLVIGKMPLNYLGKLQSNFVALMEYKI